MVRRLALPTLLYALMLVVGSAFGASAAPVEKVQVCHAVPGAPGHVVVELPERAVETFLSQHEGAAVVGVDVDEDCQELVSVAAVLAAAWSTDASGGRVLVAQLEDTNGDGVPSAGDTVVAGSYPLDATGTAYGRFAVPTHTIDRVVFQDARMLRVAAGSSQFEWTVNDGRNGELYLEDVGGSRTLIADGRSTTNPFDLALISSSSPSQPAHDTFVGAYAPSDGTFVDVALYTS